MRPPKPKHLALIAALIILLLLTSSPYLITHNSQHEPSEYEVKEKLVKTQDIGIHFGMPGMVPEEQQKELINQNKDLADKIRTDFHITDTHQLYIKIKQFNQITITETTETHYYFKIADGQSCNIHTHTGYYDTTTETIKITNTTTEQVPC